MRRSPRAPIVAKYSNSVKTRVVAKFLALLNVAIRKMLSWAWKKGMTLFSWPPNVAQILPEGLIWYTLQSVKKTFGGQKKGSFLIFRPLSIFSESRSSLRTVRSSSGTIYTSKLFHNQGLKFENDPEPFPHHKYFLPTQNVGLTFSPSSSGTRTPRELSEDKLSSQVFSGSKNQPFFMSELSPYKVIKALCWYRQSLLPIQSSPPSRTDTASALNR